MLPRLWIVMHACTAAAHDGRRILVKRYPDWLLGTQVHHGWGVVFVKGIFANWLVGIATWMANAAQVRF
jgi:hypothetical protein